MASSAEIEAAARSLAVTVVSGSRETAPDAERPGGGPRWLNWKHAAQLALEAAEFVREPSEVTIRKIRDEWEY